MIEVSVLVLAAAISMFYRGLIAVIAPELAIDLGLGEAELGTLASLLFIGFAAAQPPVGMALDRWGPRLTIVIFMVPAVFGTGLFASATGAGMAYAGQILIGVGCAPIMTGAMVVVGRRYTPDKFAFMVSLVLALANIGDLASAAPFAWLSEAIGWRGALWTILGLTTVSALACFVFVGRDRHAKGTHPENLGELSLGMIRVMGMRVLWPILPLVLTGYAGLMALRGLWAGPYLAETFGLDPAGRGMVLLAMSAAMTLGMFLYGVIDRKWERRKLLVGGGTAMVALACTGLAIEPTASLTLSGLLLGMVGLFGYTYAVMMAHCRTFLPTAILGRGIAFLTLVGMFGVGLVQWLSGQIMDSTGSYALMFASLAGILAIAVLIYAFSREGPSSPP